MLRSCFSAKSGSPPSHTGGSLQASTFLLLCCSLTTARLWGPLAKAKWGLFPSPCHRLDAQNKAPGPERDSAPGGRVQEGSCSSAVAVGWPRLGISDAKGHLLALGCSPSLGCLCYPCSCLLVASPHLCPQWGLWTAVEELGQMQIIQRHSSQQPQPQGWKRSTPASSAPPLQPRGGTFPSRGKGETRC